MLGAPIIRQYIKIGDVQMELDAVEAFINDLYDNAGLSLPLDFNPVDEVIKVVNTLRGQVKVEEC